MRLGLATALLAIMPPSWRRPLPRPLAYERGPNHHWLVGAILVANDGCSRAHKIAGRTSTGEVARAGSVIDDARADDCFGRALQVQGAMPMATRGSPGSDVFFADCGACAATGRIHRYLCGAPTAPTPAWRPVGAQVRARRRCLREGSGLWQTGELHRHGFVSASAQCRRVGDRRGSGEGEQIAAACARRRTRVVALDGDRVEAGEARAGGRERSRSCAAVSVRGCSAFAAGSLAVWQRRR
jgi:hypothetical protein